MDDPEPDGVLFQQLTAPVVSFVCDGTGYMRRLYLHPRESRYAVLDRPQDDIHIAVNSARPALKDDESIWPQTMRNFMAPRSF